MLYDIEFLTDFSERHVAAFGTMRVGKSFSYFLTSGDADFRIYTGYAGAALVRSLLHLFAPHSEANFKPNRRLSWTGRGN